MRINKKSLAFGIFLAGLALSSGVFAYSNSANNWQSYQPSFNRLYSGDASNYWPILNRMKNDQCNATSDFVIAIPPGGCTPAVVRSDLLEEQNVPVFCQLYAIKINPLIKVSSIKSISFKNYPEGVRSVVFHPARAAVKSYTTLLGDPTINNIGYVVIILKQNRIEKNMAEWIAGNLTATIRYDAEKAYGTGAAEYYLPVMSGEDWNTRYAESAFWNGRGYLRAESIEKDRAKIQLLVSPDKVVRTFNLKEGETSALTYLPGYYCKAGLKIRLNKLVTPEDKALLNIDGQRIWVREGTKFLNGKCTVRNLDVKANNDGEIDLSCSGAGNIGPLSLRKKGANIRTEESETKEYHLGDRIENKNLYLIYYGAFPKSESEKTEFIILSKENPTKKEAKRWFKSISEKLSSSDSFDSFKKKVKGIEGLKEASVIPKGKGESGLTFEGLADKPNENIYTRSGSNNLVEEYFKEANDTVGDLISEYKSELKENGEAFGEEALYEQIVLAGNLGKFKTQGELMDLFVATYPSSKIIEQIREDRQKLKGTDYSESYTSVYVGDSFHSISVVDFRSVDEGKKKVDLRIGNVAQDNLMEGWEKELGSAGKLSVIEILPGKVKLRFDSSTKGVKTFSRVLSVECGI